MNEFQISLLAIGIVLVLAVYGYNIYQQRQHQRRFNATFQARQGDVLLHPSEVAQNAATTQPLAGDSGARGEAVLDAPVLLRADADACSLLGDPTDFIVLLTMPAPASAHVLAPLWQQRFDFGKSVYACGLNAATGEWERAVADGHGSYASFKLALQLADRSGAVSEVRLSDFRDLVRMLATQMEAEIEMPDVAAASARAMVLDTFCAQVDQMIGLNIVPAGERSFSGVELARVAALHGMVLQADGAFHLLDVHEYTLFTLCNQDNAPFQRHTLEQMWITSLTLLLDVPRVEQPTQRFDEMAVFARRLAMDLHAAVVDDHQVALGEPGIAQIHQQVAIIEQHMLAGNVTPGSRQARRLFS